MEAILAGDSNGRAEGLRFSICRAMQPKVSTEGSATVLDFEEPDSLRGFFERAETQVGFLLTLDRELKLFTRCALIARAGPNIRFDFEAEVIQSFPAPDGRFGIAFQLADWKVKKQELARRLGRGEQDESEYLGTSPAFRIKNLNTAERMRLAVKADRNERQILLRDNSPQVLMGLLNNPRIEDGDVLDIVKSIYATGAILQRIAKDRRWSGNYEIQLAVVKNPKTPTPLAQRMIEGLRTQDLRVLAKSTYVREAIKRTALRVYERRK